MEKVLLWPFNIMLLRLDDIGCSHVYIKRDFAIHLFTFQRGSTSSCHSTVLAAGTVGTCVGSYYLWSRAV